MRVPSITYVFESTIFTARSNDLQPWTERRTRQGPLYKTVRTPTDKSARRIRSHFACNACSALPCFVIQCRVARCLFSCAWLWFAMWCYAMLCYASLCFATPCLVKCCLAHLPLVRIPGFDCMCKHPIVKPVGRLRDPTDGAP